jgi:hypothetical protein
MQIKSLQPLGIKSPVRSKSLFGEYQVWHGAVQNTCDRS